MLKMSQKSSYAVKALIYMAKNSHGEPVNLHRVSELQNIPLPFLEQIFSKLKKAGLVDAVRGPQGGFKLAQPPENIQLAKIIAVLEGPFEPVLCSFPENKSDDCHEVDGCISRTLCNDLDGAILNVLNGKTLGTMCGEAEKLHHITKPTL